MARPRKLPPEPPPRTHERRRGEGTVREVRPGVWRAWRARQRRPDGATVRPSATFEGEGAEQRAKVWAAGQQMPAIWTLGRWLDYWLALRMPTLRPMSAYNYRRHIKACAPLHALPLTAVTVDDFQALTNELLRVRVRSDVANWRGIISSALRAAQARNLRPDNPMAGVRLPRADERPVRAWTADEARKLLDAARGSPHEAWLWLALGTGARLGELRALRRTDIDAAALTVRITRSCDSHTNEMGPTKTGRSRTVDLPAEAMPALTAHLARLPASEPLVFRSPQTTGPTRARSYQEWIARLCERASVTVLTCHSTRHTFATLALDAGVPLKEVSEALGHANVATTAKVYSHQAEQQRRRRAATAIGSALSGPIPTPIRANGSQIGTRKGR